MFGGISANPLCSSATVGSTALGDTAGGANTEDCMGGDSFRWVLALLLSGVSPLKLQQFLLFTAGGPCESSLNFCGLFHVCVIFENCSRHAAKPSPCLGCDSTFSMTSSAT